MRMAQSQADEMEGKKMPSNKTHVYICSAGHSGSTLLDMLLGTHPECESLGELSLLPMDIALANRCGCGANYHECQMWSPVLSEYSRERGIAIWNAPYAMNLGYMAGINVDRCKINALYRLKWRPILALKYAQQKMGMPLISPLVGEYDDGTRNTLDLYDRVLRHTGKSVTVDSTKHYLKAAAIYRARPENTRLVLLVRDGRGVFYSGLKRGFPKDYSLKSWLNYYNRSLPLFKKCVAPQHIHTVKYEEFVQNPRGILESVCQFLEIDFDPHMLDFKSIIHHNVNGNDIKFTSTAELRLDEAWKLKLESPDRDYFERHAGALNRHLGYV